MLLTCEKSESMSNYLDEHEHIICFEILIMNE